jgi:hypothetical protein
MPVATVHSVDSTSTAHNTTAVVVHTDLEVVEAVGTAVTAVPHHNPLDRIVAAEIDSPPGMPHAVSVSAGVGAIAAIGVAIDSPGCTATPAPSGLSCWLAEGEQAHRVAVADRSRADRSRANRAAVPVWAVPVAANRLDRWATTCPRRLSESLDLARLKDMDTPAVISALGSVVKVPGKLARSTNPSKLTGCNFLHASGIRFRVFLHLVSELSCPCLCVIRTMDGHGHKQAE